VVRLIGDGSAGGDDVKRADAPLRLTDLARARRYPDPSGNG
jgi:hypothetical protein